MSSARILDSWARETKECSGSMGPTGLGVSHPSERLCFPGLTSAPQHMGLIGSVTCSVRTSLHIQPKRRPFLYFFPLFFQTSFVSWWSSWWKKQAKIKKTKNFLPKLRIWGLYTSGYGDHRYIFLNCAFYSFSNEDMCTMKTFKNNHSFKPKQDCSGVLCVLDTSFETAAGGHTSRGLGWGDLTGADSWDHRSSGRAATDGRDEVGT